MRNQVITFTICMIISAAINAKNLDVVSKKRVEAGDLVVAVAKIIKKVPEPMSEPYWFSIRIDCRGDKIFEKKMKISVCDTKLEANIKNGSLNVIYYYWDGPMSSSMGLLKCDYGSPVKKKFSLRSICQSSTKS